MLIHVIGIIATLYLGICLGLLNQASAIKELESTKSFIPIAPIVYLILLFRAVYKFASVRSKDSKSLVRAYLKLKSALIIMLFSVAEVLEEGKARDQIKVVRKSIFRMNIPELIKQTGRTAWKNMNYATA